MAGGVFLLCKFVFNKSDIFRLILRLTIIVVLCCFTFFALMAASASVLCRVDFSYSILPVVTGGIMAVSSAFNGFVISRWYKENGIIWGLIAGAAMLFMIVLLSVQNSIFAFSSVMLLKAATVLISGAIGGIIGVNIN